MDSLRAVILSELESEIRAFTDNYPIHSILLANRSGEIIVNSNASISSLAVGENLSNVDEDFFNSAYKSKTFRKPASFDGNHQLLLYGKPLIDDFNSSAGVVVLVKDLSPIFEIVDSKVAGFTTMQSILTVKEQDRAIYLSPLKNVADSLAPDGV